MATKKKPVKTTFPGEGYETITVDVPRRIYDYVADLARRFNITVKAMAEILLEVRAEETWGDYREAEADKRKKRK